MNDQILSEKRILCAVLKNCAFFYAVSIKKSKKYLKSMAKYGILIKIEVYKRGIQGYV